MVEDGRTLAVRLEIKLKKKCAAHSKEELLEIEK